MSTFILIFLLLVCVLVLLSTLAFTVLMTHDQMMVRGAPFVPIPKAVLKGILETFDIHPGDVVYDLGCGDGRVLKALAKQCPEARFVGVDKGFIPYFFASLNTRKLKKLNYQERGFFPDRFIGRNICLCLSFPWTNGFTVAKV